jgi:hypothetical protein
VLDTVSLIALEASDFMCHSRAEYYICCICVGYSTHYEFSAVSFVCQTSTVAAAVPAVSYCIMYMWQGMLCAIDCVYGIPTFFSIFVGNLIS